MFHSFLQKRRQEKKIKNLQFRKTSGQTVFPRWTYQEHTDWGCSGERWPYFTLEADGLILQQKLFKMVKRLAIAKGHVGKAYQNVKNCIYQKSHQCRRLEAVFIS